MATDALSLFSYQLFPAPPAARWPPRQDTDAEGGNLAMIRWLEQLVDWTPAETEPPPETAEGEALVRELTGVLVAPPTTRRTRAKPEPWRCVGYNRRRQGSRLPRIREM